MSIVLKADGISKSFQSAREKKLIVLNQCNLQLTEGCISIIVGASGSGKSTLLHILGGLDKPDSGSVFFRDTDIFRLSERKLNAFRNKSLGFVFQFHHLLPEFTAIENICIPQMIAGKSLKNAGERGRQLLEELGVQDRGTHKPAELSGGEQQRIAIARALANDPDILLADEPTGNLDSKNSEAVATIFTDLKQKYGKTLLIVTHQKELVSIADQVFEMKDGTVHQIR